MTTADRVRAAVRRMAAGHADRDRYMKQMRAEGATLRDIAEAAGLTHAGVKQILDRDES